METDVRLLKKQINKEVYDWNTDNYNWLAIGNSITKHGICDYWWNECGMAATILDNDYVHQFISIFEENSKEKIDCKIFNFSEWEVLSKDRTQTVPLLDGFLDKSLDLVTIQLSENIVDITTFEVDLTELVEYVKAKAPNAQIVLIDDFWDTEKSEIKRKASERLDVDFLNLDEIRGNKEYQQQLGQIVYDIDGGEHIVEHLGVASHPNDDAMKYIATKLYSLVKQEYL